jgi:Taurine catabolism dioxygenase TauD, TfdA family
MAAASSSTQSIAENLLPFQPFSLPPPNQRILGEPHAPGTVIPLALKLAPEQVVGNDAAASLDAVITTVKQLADRGELDAALARHGTLLFRGLPIESADDFSRFSHAFGYQPHEIIGIVVDRPLLAKNVAPANESALTTTIGSHNESPQVPHGGFSLFC